MALPPLVQGGVIDVFTTDAEWTVEIETSVASLSTLSPPQRTLLLRSRRVASAIEPFSDGSATVGASASYVRTFRGSVKREIEPPATGSEDTRVASGPVSIALFKVT